MQTRFASVLCIVENLRKWLSITVARQSCNTLLVCWREWSQALWCHDLNCPQLVTVKFTSLLLSEIICFSFKFFSKSFPHEIFYFHLEVKFNHKLEHVKRNNNDVFSFTKYLCNLWTYTTAIEAFHNLSNKILSSYFHCEKKSFWFTSCEKEIFIFSFETINHWEFILRKKHYGKLRWLYSVALVFTLSLQRFKSYVKYIYLESHFNIKRILIYNCTEWCLVKFVRYNSNTNY